MESHDTKSCPVVPSDISALKWVGMGATPVPVRETACGLFVAKTQIESVAVIAPVAAGVNVTLMVHEVWAASDVPQVVAEMANSLALVPVMVSPERVIAVLSLFVSVTVFAALALLRTCLPKARIVTEVVAWATPVPVRLTVCGQMLALSAIESVAVMAPVAAGVNVTLIVHEVWALSLIHISEPTRLGMISY